MIEWLLVSGDQRELVYRCFGAAWSGGQACESIVRLGPGWVTVAWPLGSRAQRAPRWPDVLADWREFHDEALFPSAEVPVLAEEVSALGANALALSVAPGAARADIGWYHQGGLAEWEHVGATTAAWYPDAGLDVPRLSGALAAAVDLARAAAESAAEASVYDRIHAGLAASATAIYKKALHRLLGADPPDCDDLAGIVAKAPTARWRL